MKPRGISLRELLLLILALALIVAGVGFIAGLLSEP